MGTICGTFSFLSRNSLQYNRHKSVTASGLSKWTFYIEHSKVLPCPQNKDKTKGTNHTNTKFIFPGKLDFVTRKTEHLSLITVVYSFITETQTSIFVLDKLIGLPCRNGFSISFKKLTFCWTLKVVRGHVLDVK